MTQPEEWTCSHFSLGNPRGKTQSDLPRPLRRLATSIAGLGRDTMILDVTITDEIDENGPSRDGWKNETDDELGPPTSVALLSRRSIGRPGMP